MVRVIPRAEISEGWVTIMAPSLSSPSAIHDLLRTMNRPAPRYGTGSSFMILQADRVSRVESSGGRGCNALPVRANH